MPTARQRKHSIEIVASPVHSSSWDEWPNSPMLMGPHSPVANQSLTMIAEIQADYARLSSPRRSTESAIKGHSGTKKTAMPQTLWATVGQSWDLGKDGLP